MTPIEHVLSKLPDARPSGKGWAARCPAHDDRQASLSIGEGDDGKTLIYCHKGCATNAICAAIGLTPSALFDQSDSPPRISRDQARRSTRTAVDSPSFAMCEEAIEHLERNHGTRSNTWTYLSAEGAAVGVIVRWDLPDGGKTIKPVSLKDSRWHLAGMPKPRPLYGLLDLPTVEQVFVCEGEKACEAARSIGLVATTSPHGAQSAGTADWSPLAGKRVVILPDNDVAGAKYAESVATILAKLSPAPEVVTVELPGLPPGGDIADYIDKHDAVESEVIRQRIETMAARAVGMSAAGPILQCLADVEPKNVDWLWPNRIALGRLTLLVGNPGEGKSLLTMDMTARVTRGDDWPDATTCPEGSVILISAEDDAGDTIRPRLDVHGADCRRVHLFKMVRRAGKDGAAVEVMFSLDDIPALEAALQLHADCRLVIVDPIGSFLGGSTDAHRDNEVRAVLAPVAVLAERHDVAILIVAHRRKGAGNSADELALGSRAFTGIARAVWHLGRDPDDKRRRLFVPGKNNLADQGTGLAFTLEGTPPKIIWDSQSVEMNADEALAAESKKQSKPGPAPQARTEAANWLAGLLKNEPADTGKIKTEAKEAGHVWRTVQRAAEVLKVVRKKPEFEGGWTWSLPNSARELGPTEQE